MLDQSVYPSHPTPGVNRGYDAKTLREDGTLAKATATCGAVVYRGDAYPADYRGNAFVPEPSVNLIKRLLLNEQDGVIKATDGAKGREFLTSTDERFRPVQVVNGPDGCLYVVDMYRGIVQHTAFLTHYLEANIKARHLEQPFNQGRIWRIVPEAGRKVARTTIPADAAGRVKLLAHADGWVRDTAQRLLVEAGDGAVGPALKALATDAQAPALGRLHALWTLDGLGLVDAALIQAALRDAHPQVRAAAARLAPPDALPALAALTKESDKLVLTHVAMRLSAMNQPAADEALADLLARHGDVALLREAALTGVRGRETSLAKAVAARGAGTPAQAALESLATLIAAANKAGPFEEMLTLAASLGANRDAQAALLRGLASDGNTAKGKNAKATPAKLLWLAKEPAALASLQGQKALTAVVARIAWPGKPGAPAQPKIAPLNAAQTALFEKGKVTFNTLCAACHQPHGFGLDGLAPPLVDSDWVLGKPDVLVRIVSHGLGGPVKVSGRTWDLTMPPLPQLTDEDVAGVLTYIRREWEHTASPVDAKFVHDTRALDAGRNNGWTADELRPPTRITTKK
jgi:mono/diheme cytochrome c family protein